MELGIDEELGVEREVIYLNSLQLVINEIFDKELALPDYYDEKKLKKWQSGNGKSYIG